MSTLVCPHLCTLDAQQNQSAPVEYPSFENLCLLAPEEEATLLLTEQATFCLASGHRLCLRFQAANGPARRFIARANSAPPAPKLHKRAERSNELASAPPTLPVEQREPVEIGDLQGSPASNNRHWRLMGASALFVVALLCGGMMAAYTGWQVASQRLFARPAGNVETLTGEAGAQPSVYLVQTATTSAPLAAANNLTPTLIVLKPGETPVAPVAGAFPAAVTPTPVVVAYENGTQTNVNIAVSGNITGTTIDPAGSNAPPNIILPTGEVPISALPFDIQLILPTRRTTPVFDISTGAPVLTTTVATPTPLPPLGTPQVIFLPKDKAIPPNGCTLVRWEVTNVREVYYENIPVYGKGEKEECIRESNGFFTLRVTLGDGSTKLYTTTVDVVFPTPTPTPTASFTPEVLATPTWTPEVPTVTPTPEVHYATTLAVNGDNHQLCQPGQSCEIGLLVTNAGDTLDQLTVELVQSAAWTALLCRADGDCFVNRLTLTNIGSGNTLFIIFKVIIPADATPQTVTYALRSLSEGSRGAVISATVNLELEVPSP